MQSSAGGWEGSSGGTEGQGTTGQRTRGHQTEPRAHTVPTGGLRPWESEDRRAHTEEVDRPGTAGHPQPSSGDRPIAGSGADGTASHRE